MHCLLSSTLPCQPIVSMVPVLELTFFLNFEETVCASVMDSIKQGHSHHDISPWFWILLALALFSTTG